MVEIEFTVTADLQDSGTRVTNSKRVNVPGAKILWLVQYGTHGEWVQAGVYRGDFGDPNVHINASKLATALKDKYGFQIKRDTKTDNGTFGFGGSYRESIYVGTNVKGLERAFEDEPSARAWHDELRKVFPTPSGLSVGVNDRVIQVGSPSLQISDRRHEAIKDRAKHAGSSSVLSGVYFGGHGSKPAVKISDRRHEAIKNRAKGQTSSKSVTVEIDTDVFDSPNGNETGVVLEAGTKGVTLLQKDGDWYHVKWPAGQGWVWSGPGHLSIKLP